MSDEIRKVPPPKTGKIDVGLDHMGPKRRVERKMTEYPQKVTPNQKRGGILTHSGGLF